MNYLVGDDDEESYSCNKCGKVSIKKLQKSGKIHGDPLVIID